LFGLSSWPLVALLVSVQCACEPFSKGSAGETEFKFFSKSFEPFLKGLEPLSGNL
jgi:hypothetical protein